MATLRRVGHFPHREAPDVGCRARADARRRVRYAGRVR
jgi:hypothetical protein